MTCPRCDGEGVWWIGHGGDEKEMGCFTCNGTGEVETEEED